VRRRTRFRHRHQTSRAFENLKKGIAELAKTGRYQNNGNSSVARAPLAAGFPQQRRDLVALAMPNPCSRMAMRSPRLLRPLPAGGQAFGRSTMSDVTVRRNRPGRDLPRHAAPHAQALALRAWRPNRPPRGSGYVVDGLWSACSACRDLPSPASSRLPLRWATVPVTACIAGGLAGIHFGFDAINCAGWISARTYLPGKPLERLAAAQGLNACSRAGSFSGSLSFLYILSH
jgi:hypothetical protein